MKDTTLALFKELRTEFAARFGGSIVPLFRCDTAAIQGTGTLLQIADDRFLVTAKHVVEPEDEPPPDLFVADAAPEPRPIPLSGRLATQDKPADVAAFRVDKETGRALVGHNFLTCRDIRLLWAPPEKGIYVIWGYPAAWMPPLDDADVSGATTLGYAATLYLGSTSWIDTDKTPYDPRCHVLLKAAKGHILDEEGKPDELPELAGISGCSIWHIQATRTAEGAWSAKTSQVVAVETAMFPQHGVIKGTYWGAVAKVLWDGCPELRRALKLYWPSRIFLP